MIKEITIICDTTNFKTESEEDISPDRHTQIAHKVARNFEDVGAVVKQVSVALHLGDGFFNEPDVFNYEKSLIV